VVPSRSAPHLFLFAEKLPYYYVILAMALGALALTRRLERSPLGYRLVAVRENEDAAEAAGVDALGVKLRAMAISSFMTALGGTFYAQYFSYIDPTITFGPGVSIQGLLQAIVGGAGTVLGPFLGAFVLTPVSELSRSLFRGRAGVFLRPEGPAGVDQEELDATAAAAEEEDAGASRCRHRPESYRLGSMAKPDPATSTERRPGPVSDLRRRGYRPGRRGCRRWPRPRCSIPPAGSPSRLRRRFWRRGRGRRRRRW